MDHGVSGPSGLGSDHTDGAVSAEAMALVDSAEEDMGTAAGVEGMEADVVATEAGAVVTEAGAARGKPPLTMTMSLKKKKTSPGNPRASFPMKTTSNPKKN